MKAWSATALVTLAALSTTVRAQFDQPAAGHGPRLAAVTALPAPGTYNNTTGIQLHAANGAAIMYTLDGSAPSRPSARLMPGQQLFVTGVYDGAHGLRTGYTIRAIASADGHTDSEPATFGYTVERRDRTAYLSEEVAPGVRMIRDSDNDKMFLLCGPKACVLIDTGMGRGALRDYVARFTGGRPLAVILTHFHGDHAGQAGQFIAGSIEYVGASDREQVARQLAEQGATPAAIAAHLKGVPDGARVDLGDRQLELYAVPGHTPGSIVILDPATGDLFTGDSFGNNSSLPPDVMWLQFDRDPLDRYLANVRLVRAALDGRVRRIMTGHNDHPLQGTGFLDHLERAVQRGLDRGDAALVPSWRPQGGVQLVEGDRFADPDWFGANVDRASYLPAPPDRIAGLTGLFITGARLSPRFSPAVHDYVAAGVPRGATVRAWPTATRSRSFTVNGRPAKPGTSMPIDTRRDLVVEVTAPDGVQKASYRVRLR